MDGRVYALLAQNVEIQTDNKHTSLRKTRLIRKIMNIRLAQASWELKIGNLFQISLLDEKRCASAACRSGPTTPPVATRGSLEKLRALELGVPLTSPIMVAVDTRIEELMSPQNARIKQQLRRPLLKPMATQDIDNPSIPIKATGLRPSLSPIHPQ